MGYALPDGGTPYTDGLAWYLVAIPDDPAFRRAAMGAYTGLADVWVWGLEKAKTPEDRALQADARRVWLQAINATWANMTILDDLLAAVDGVESLLQELIARSCCAPGGPISLDGGPTVDPIAVQQDVPSLDLTDDTTWPPDYETDPTGATDFADLAAISDYLCRAASTAVGLLLDMLTIAGWFHSLAFSINTLTQEWISAALTRVFPTSQGLLVAFGYDQLVELLAPWAEDLDQAALDNARTELEAVQASLVCAFAQADDYSEAFSNAQAVLLATLTNTVVYTWMTSGGLLGFALALLFRGWADPEDNSCNCTAPAELTPIFTKQGDACTPASSNWVLNPNPVEYWYTNTPMTFDDSITYGNCSSGDRLAIGFYDEDLLNNPQVVVTACRVKLVDWVASGYANAVIFMDTNWNQIGTVANGSVVLGEWIDAPANTHAILVDYQNGYTAIQIEIELLEY